MLNKPKNVASRLEILVCTTSNIISQQLFLKLNYLKALIFFLTEVAFSRHGCAQFYCVVSC